METLLEIKDLSYNVKEREILKSITLTIKKGEIHSIVGVNGSGKTTLSSVLMGLQGYKPKSGKIIFLGKDITNLTVTERAQAGITLAWQNPAVFEGVSVNDYLSINSKEPEKVLNLVGLNSSYLHRKLNEKLSGGERKRIELASAISMEPQLIILDEPDSGIDMASINRIRNIMSKFKESGGSVILITHNEKIASYGDIASLMCKGKIVKEGSPKEVTRYFKEFCKRCDHVGEIDEETLK